MRKHILKRTVAITLSLAMTIGSAIIPATNNGVHTAYAQDNVKMQSSENISDEVYVGDFNLYKYRADLYLKGGSVSNNIIENMMIVDFPSKIIVRQLEADSEFQNDVKAWEILHIATSPSEITDKLIDRKGYYTAVLLSIFKAESEQEYFAYDCVNKIESETNKLFSNMKEWVSQSDKFDNEKIYKNQYINDFSIDEKKGISEFLEEQLKKQHPIVANISTLTSDINSIFDAVSTLGEAINLLESYIQVSEMYEGMKNVLRLINERCSDDNLPMKKACEEVTNATYGLTDSINSTLSNTMGKETATVAGIIVDDLWEFIIQSNPYSEAFMSGAGVGTWIGDTICNTLFATDKTIEQYYKMQCLDDLMELIREVTDEIGNTYIKNPTTQSAENYFSAVDALFSIADMSCRFALDYADILYNDAALGWIGNKENYDRYVYNVGYIQEAYKNNQDSLMQNFIDNLEIDNKDIYNILMGVNEKESEDEIEGIYFEDEIKVVDLVKENLWISQAKILPKQNYNIKIKYESSNKNVVDIEEYGILEPKQEGEAIITARTEDGKYTATQKILVKDNYKTYDLFDSGDGSKENPYKVATDMQLNCVRFDLSANYELISDIDLGIFNQWKQIGDSLNHFSGTFNGNNYTISNLKIIEDYYSDKYIGNYVGLFSYCEDAVLENIKLYNVDIEVYQSYIGGLAGYSKNTIIRNCDVQGFVYGIGDLGEYAGGIVPVNEQTSSIINSTFKGGIEVGYGAGGIAGKNDGIILYCSVSSEKDDDMIYGSSNTGGITGLNNGQIKYCYNSDYIIGNAWAGPNIGGIAGVNNGYVEQSFNKGNIKGTSLDHNASDLGGICGKNKNGIITNCFNIGRIQSDRSNVNGIASEPGDGIKNCFNIGELNGHTEDEEKDDNYYLDYGITKEDDNVEGCYYLDNVKQAGAGEMLTEKDFNNKYMFKNYDFKNIWFISNDIKYPQLKMEYAQYICSNVVSNTSLIDLSNMLGEKIKVLTNNNEEVIDLSSKIATGYRVYILNDNENINEYEVCVKGDLDGTGTINVMDMEAAQKHILGIKKLTGVYEQAGLITSTDNISVLDMEAMQKDILGIKKISG